MKKNILKNIVIIALCIIIVLIVVAKVKNNFVYVDDGKVCKKCVVIDKIHYCETYGLESDK